MYRTGNIRHNIYSSSKISPEKYLIALILHDNEIYYRIKDVVKPEMFQEKKLRTIFEEITSNLEGGKQVQIKDIIYLIQDEDGLISDFNDIAKALFEAEDIFKMLEDILQKILLNHLERQREEIRKEILNAHLLGDLEKEKELLLKLQNCEKEMLKIKDGQKERNP